MKTPHRVHPVNLTLEARWKAMMELGTFSARSLSEACKEPWGRMLNWLWVLEDLGEVIRVGADEYKLIAPVRF